MKAALNGIIGQKVSTPRSRVIVANAMQLVRMDATQLMVAARVSTALQVQRARNALMATKVHIARNVLVTDAGQCRAANVNRIASVR